MLLLCLFTILDIKEGDEITYDYGGYDLSCLSPHQKDIVSSTTFYFCMNPILGVT